MNKGILTILIFFGFTNANFAQNDGVLSFDVPAKNSLKFNKFLINPSFSFVREDEAFLSVLNKRQFLGVENAPEAYFVSYSGKFLEQNSLGFGLFQRKFGILTSFGAVANLARNVELRDDNNLTFGFNLVYLNSGLNSSAIVVNDLSDPSIANTPKNSLFTVNPGVNYGSRYIDLGLSVNNLFYYNLSDSNLVSDDPQKSVSGHFMYTGYLDNSGIFENSKFSTLLKADLGKEKTVLSGAILFNAPKAFWAQAGYHSLNGASVGVGFILAKKFSIGYTLEKGLSNFSGFGMSHEITLAYKIKGYGDFEDYKPIVRATNKTNPVKTTPQRPANEIAKERQAELLKRQAEQRAKIEAERQRKQQEIADARAALDAKNKAAAEARLKSQQDKQNALSEAARLKAEQEKARLEAEKLRKEQAAAEAKAKAEADKLRKEQAAAEAKAKAEETERLRKEKAEADARAKAEAERLRKEQAAAEAKAKAEADKLRKEQAAAEAKAKAEETERLRKEKAEADARAKAEAERLRKEQAAADAKAKAEAEKLRKEQAAAEAKAKAEEAERLRKEKAEADARAKAEEEKAKAEAERLRKEQELADAKAKAEADKLRKEQAAAEAKAKAEEAERLRKEKAE
ncbi:MAG: PorP/SprF family type IX secretion system membrane protein, partial [Limnohabitans sp.]|nr:PorP/SprF family type IX secretion system membrane protein [Limnohabitans sp.]